MITALIIVVWLLLIAFLIGQYTGFVRYMFHPQTFYLQELHNFNAEVTEVPLSQTTVTIPLKVQAPEPQILYRDENYTITLTYVSFDEDSYTQKNPTRRWWVEISYTRHASFNEVSYVSPAQSGTATVTLANGETVTQELRWQGESYDENTAFVRLCFLEVPKDTPTEGCFASISFDAMSHVRWTRTGIGSRAN